VRRLSVDTIEQSPWDWDTPAAPEKEDSHHEAAASNDVPEVETFNRTDDTGEFSGSKRANEKTKKLVSNLMYNTNSIRYLQ